MAQQMPNTIELYEAAAQAFRQTLSGVKEDQMNGGTPCPLWNVQALINHNIKVTGFVHGMLSENITVNSSDVIGHQLPAEGSVAAFDAGVARVLELIKAPGSVEKQINTPFGAMTRGEVMLLPRPGSMVQIFSVWSLGITSTCPGLGWRRLSRKATTRSSE